jgi:mRNA interferase HigB
MRIFNKSTLKDFWLKHPDCEQALRSWYSDTKNADWSSTHDIKNDYRTADFIGDNRVIFNIKGNNYRLIVKIFYDRKICYVKFIGTHAEYDKIDALTVEIE